MAIPLTSATAALLILGALGCSDSKRPLAPTTSNNATDEAAPHLEKEGWRCTSEDIAQLKISLETSCSLRPKFRDDCLALYQTLPVAMSRRLLTFGSGSVPSTRPFAPRQQHC